MKTIFFILILCVSLFGIATIQNPKSAEEVVVRLSAEQDTFLYPGPIQLKIAVINKSKDVVYIPKVFSLTSNLYPNGVNNREDNGARINFEIQPVSKWQVMHIENLSSSQPLDFIKLRSSARKDFIIDIEPHLKQFIQTDLSDTVGIALNKVYQVKVKYQNLWRYQRKPEQTFIGEEISNQVTIYLKQE